MKLAIKASCNLIKKDAKINAIQLDGFNGTDPEAIGIYMIKLSATWKPKTGEEDVMKMGLSYGFDLYIRRQQETYEDKGMFEYRYQNVYYAESKKTGIKYTWNQGHINIDNPKIAARYFLNAIDRVEALKEKYQKSLHELEQNIPMLQQLVSKPFEKEEELSQLKKDVSKLEREISIKIQANQMKQHNTPDDNTVELKEAPVIKMEYKELKTEKNRLSEKEMPQRKKRSLRI